MWAPKGSGFVLENPLCSGDFPFRFLLISLDMFSFSTRNSRLLHTEHGVEHIKSIWRKCR